MIEVIIEVFALVAWLRLCFLRRHEFNHNTAKPRFIRPTLDALDETNVIVTRLTARRRINGMTVMVRCFMVGLFI